MFRFFHSKTVRPGELFSFSADHAHQISRVLRLKVGEAVLVLDGKGNQARIRLVDVNGQVVSGTVEDVSAVTSEPGTHLTLWIGLTQREKFEWVLQKCTEVGITRFAPFISSRSLLQDISITEKKQERWQKIIEEAAEQSGRGIVPVLEPPVRLDEALKRGKAESSISLFAWEDEKQTSLHTALQGMSSNSRMALMIGPEGGFSEQEASAAIQAGWQAVTLGPRILRMETAAVTASALILYQMGDME